MNKLKISLLFVVLLFVGVNSCFPYTAHKTYIGSTDNRFAGIGLLYVYNLSDEGLINEISIYNFRNYPKDLQEAIESTDKNLITRYTLEKNEEYYIFRKIKYSPDVQEDIFKVKLKSDNELELIRLGKNGYTITAEIDNKAPLSYNVFDNSDKSSVYQYWLDGKNKIIKYFSSGRVLKYEDFNDYKIFSNEKENIKSVVRYNEDDEGIIKFDLYYDDKIEDNNIYASLYLKDPYKGDFSSVASILNFHFLSFSIMELCLFDYFS